MKAVVKNNGEISHQPCPYEDCASSDAFSYNINQKVGHCHSCGRGYPGSDNNISGPPRDVILDGQ